MEGDGAIDYSICGNLRVVNDMMRGKHGEILDVLDMAHNVTVRLLNLLASANKVVGVACSIEQTTVFVRASSITLLVA